MSIRYLHKKTQTNPPNHSAAFIARASPWQTRHQLLRPRHRHLTTPLRTWPFFPQPPHAQHIGSPSIFPGDPHIPTLIAGTTALQKRVLNPFPAQYAVSVGIPPGDCAGLPSDPYSSMGRFLRHKSVLSIRLPLR